MSAERAELGGCTLGANIATAPRQPGALQAGDDAVRHGYIDCQRCGCSTSDYVFIRKGNLVSVLINSSAAGGTLDPAQTAQFATRAGSLLAAVSQ